jgi:hypothetical protein
MKIQKPLPKVIITDGKVYYGKDVIGQITGRLNDTGKHIYATISSIQKQNFSKYKNKLEHIFKNILNRNVFYTQHSVDEYDMDNIYVFTINPEHAIFKK